MRWREAFAPILGTADPARLKPFLHDVLEAESSALCTPSGFDDALANVLVKWHLADHLAEVLRVMNAIEVYEGVMGVAQSLQQAGVNCHIASNQQAGRARHMSETLNYRTRFTGEFYSCGLGAAKPELAFFEHILHALNLPGNNVLFLDDRPEMSRPHNASALLQRYTLGKPDHMCFRKYLASTGCGPVNRAVHFPIALLCPHIELPLSGKLKACFQSLPVRHLPPAGGNMAFTAGEL